MIDSCVTRVGALLSLAARIAAVGFLAALALGATPASAQQADLVVNQADSPDPGPAGGVFTYTVRVDNNGPNAAIGIGFSDTLPPGSTFVSASTTQGTCGAPVAGVVSCALGDLAFDGNLTSVTVTVQVILPSAGVWTNTASATSGTADPNATNSLDVAEGTTAQTASDMTLTVVDSPDPIAAGGAYNYAVTAINLGPVAAASQTVTFNVPTGACITATPSGGASWSCLPAIAAGTPRCSGTITCARNAALVSGANAPVINFPAVANVGGSIAAAFQVASPLPDGNPSDNTVTATTSVTGGSSDVSIAKTAATGTVGVGANVVYTLTPRFNGGEPPGTSGSGLITVTDTLDAGLTYVSHSAGAGWTCNFLAPTLTCTRPGPFTPNYTNMPAITLTATVTAVGTIGNTASIAIPESDPNPANNSASVNVTGSNSADMSIAKSGATFPVVPGFDFNYALTPRNNGPVILAVGQVVTVTDTVPAGITIRSAPTSSGNFWTCAVTGAPSYPIAGPATVTCTRTLTATVAANANMTPITIPVETNAAGSLANTACVALSGTGPSDGNAANDCSAPSTVISSAPGAEADLRVVSKTASPNPVVAGQDLAYTIIVQNDGPGVATNVVVSDALASLVNVGGFQSATVDSGGTCTPSSATNGTSQNLVCTIPSLAVGASATVVVVIRPQIAATGTRMNTATVNSTVVGDPDRSNNTGSLTGGSTVTAIVDITAAKAATPNPVQAGTPLTYTLTVRNAGPSNAAGVVATDTLPGNAAFLNLISVSAGGSCTLPAAGTVGGTVICTWGSIASAAQATAQFRVRPLTGATSVQNDVAVTTSTPESNTGNNSASVTTPVTNAAIDLIINKVDSVDPVAIGLITTYTITVSNGGPSFATNVVMTDSFPSGSPTATFSYQGNLQITPAGSGICVEPALDATSGALTCTFPALVPALAGGQAAVIRYDMRAEALASGVSGTTFNTASVTADEAESLQANNTTTHSTTSRQGTDLALSKSAPANSIPGAALSWTLTVTNNGPNPSTGALVTDALPAGVTFAGASPGCGFAAGVVTCTLGTLAPLASTTLTIDVTISSPYAGANPLLNSATVNAVNEVDTNAANNTGSTATTVTAQADLTVAKIVDNATPSIGGNVTFTVTATNNGPNDATGVRVNDALPAGYAFVSAGPSVGSYNAGTGVWTIGNLANGVSATLQLTAAVLAGGSYANNANITATTADPDPSNNSASVGTAPVARADIVVAKTVNNGTPDVGANVVFTVTVANNGPSAAAAVQVTDVLPAGYAFVSATPTAGSYDSGTGVWSGIGTLVSGGNATLNVTATVRAAGPYLNTATGTTTTTETNTNNNSASAGTSPVAVASLAIAKTDNSATYTPGGTGTYVVVVTNGGPSAAAAVTISDTLPAGVTLADAVTCAAAGTATCGSVSGDTGAGSFGVTGASIAAGAGNALTFTAPVAYASSMTTDPLVNAVTATDPASPNASGSDSSDRSPSVALVVAKTDGSATYTPGGTATYQVTITNAGPSDAANVTVTDTLPAGLTLTAAASCVANGAAACGTVTGSNGQTGFGTAGATLGAAAGDSLVFNVPVAFAVDMTASPLVNTAIATDVATGATASGSDVDTLAAQVSLAVVKTDGSNSYSPGGTGTYTVTITNGGLSSANSVTVSDALPAGVSLTASVTCVTSVASNCGAVTGTSGQAGFGATGAVIFPGAGNALVFTVPVAFAAGMGADPLVNTAFVADGPSGATGSGSDSDARAAQVTLVVAKTDNSATYTPGGSGTYVVTVRNTGTSDALDVTVNDALPAGVTLSGTVTCVANAIATCGTVTGTNGQTSFGAQGAGIGAGAGNSIVFSVPVRFAADLTDDPLVNTATATDLASGASGSASDGDTLRAQVTLAVTKTDGSAAYTPGGSATYTIVILNTGISDAVDVRVSDPLPAGVTLSGAVTCAAVGDASCGAVSGTTGQTSFGATGARISAGPTNVLTFTAPVSFAADLATDPLVNTVTVTDVASGAFGSAADSDSRAPNEASLTKTIVPSTIAVGGTATLTIALGNANPAPLTLTAVFSDPMPAGVTIASGNSGTCPGVTIGSTLITIAAGSVIPPGGCTIVVAITSSTPGTVTNVTGSLQTGGGTAPTASAPITVTPAGGATVDLSIVKTNNGTSVAPGSVVTYTIIVTNNGPGTVAGARVTDVVPASLNGVTWTCVASAGSRCPASGSGTIDAPTDLLAGGIATFTLQGTLSASAAGTLTNTATVAPPPGVTDPTPGNDTATATVPIAARQIDLAIAKVNVGAFSPGQLGAQYRITVANVGKVPASGTVTVTEVMPAGLTATAILGAGWTCTQPAGPCIRSDPLPSGASYPVLTLTVNVAADPPSPLVNTVTLAAGGDVNDANNQAQNTVTVGPVGPGPESIPVDSPFALLLLAALLALAGAGRLRWVRRG